MRCSIDIVRVLDSRKVTEYTRTKSRFYDCRNYFVDDWNEAQYATILTSQRSKVSDVTPNLLKQINAISRLIFDAWADAGDFVKQNYSVSLWFFVKISMLARNWLRC